MTQHRIAETERASELGQRLLVGLDVQKKVVSLVDLGDRERELPTTPILDAMDLATARRDHALVTLEHGRNLLALVWMDQKHNFIVPHVVSLWM